MFELRLFQIGMYINYAILPYSRETQKMGVDLVKCTWHPTYPFIVFSVPIFVRISSQNMEGLSGIIKKFDVLHIHK